MENNTEKNISSRSIKVLLVIIVILLVGGLFAFPVYKEYRIEQNAEALAELQEHAERSKLITQLVLLQSDLGQFEYTTEQENQMSIYELRDAVQELEWKKEYKALVRQCGDYCPENLTWDNYRLGKIFE